MIESETLKVHVWPYVLVGLLVKIVISAIAYWYGTTTGKDFPSNGTAATICAVGAGIAWYAYKLNRPMQRRELILFAVGTALADLALSLLIIIGPILWIGESLSLQNIDLILGGDGATLTQQDILPLGFVMMFSTLMTFVTAIVFAWIITRKLPRRTASR